MKESHMSLQ